MNEQEQTMPPQSISEVAASLPKKEYTLKDKLLIISAFLVAFFYDRFIVSSWTWDGNGVFFAAGIFWVLYLIVLYLSWWKTLVVSRTGWLLAACGAALCIWNFIFDYRCSYGTITYFLLPVIFMAHAQCGSGLYPLSRPGEIFKRWIFGWLLSPFSALPTFFAAIYSTFASGRNSSLKKVGVALLISFPLLLLLVSLLASADMVFGYYLKKIFHFDLGLFILHSIITLVASMFFYSFIWNTVHPKISSPAKEHEKKFDLTVSSVILGSVLAVYVLFSIVQFVYLFAGAGLPDSLTYSEYARQGFWQLVLVAAINLFLFGIFLHNVSRTPWFFAMLFGLLLSTGLMLFSAIMRLHMYIYIFGLTWLRLFSAWFIVFLGIVIVLSALRMVREKFPLISSCALVLLLWYCVLGYANPEALIMKYNLKTAENPIRWLDDNEPELKNSSDDAFMVLFESGLKGEVVVRLREAALDRGMEPGYSFSSKRMQSYLKTD